MSKQHYATYQDDHRSKNIMKQKSQENWTNFKIIINSFTVEKSNNLYQKNSPGWINRERVWYIHFCSFKSSEKQANGIGQIRFVV